MINYFSKDIRKYIRFTCAILLFLMSAIFKLIPIYLLNINPNNINPMTNISLNLFSNIILLILLIILYFDYIKRDFLKIKNSKKKKLFITLDTSFRYWLIGLLIMLGSNFIISKIGIELPNNDSFVREMLNIAPLLSGISVILISPFIEEIVFRMAFKDIITNKWLFIIISSLIFGSLHVILSLTTIYQLLYLIPYCSLGFAFGFIYDYSNNIYINYLFHLFHNVLAAMITFLLAGVIL